MARVSQLSPRQGGGKGQEVEANMRNRMRREGVGGGVGYRRAQEGGQGRWMRGW